ncbi:hypothetical protein XELAEV_18006636mg [Xenopus laevis]|uniref:Uncharacterized protein n=1 Tax=Xenopus laevis TaxID=8355 RepID=A0A974DZN3_XENLA|nr:hypothetical protein XELAEV_18006636mg [Xenopus laevis]
MFTKTLFPHFRAKQHSLLLLPLASTEKGLDYLIRSQPCSATFLARKELTLPVLLSWKKLQGEAGSAGHISITSTQIIMPLFLSFLG